MAALSVQPTYPIFTDVDGQPLENGYIWIGTENLDPQTNPSAVYWDANLTLAASQPIRTLAGYPVNSGTPARLYVDGNYSIRVMNKKGSVVYHSPSATERYNANVVNGINGVSVLDFGASTSAADNTAAIAAATAAVSSEGGEVYYGGNFAASGFWENQAPIVSEAVLGSDSDYKTTASPTKPLRSIKNFVGKVTTGAGYGHFASAVDTYTEAGVDVQSGATAVFRMNSLSTNSSGTDFNKTNQVAVVANATAQSSTASASVEAFNAIAESLYTGSTPQMVIGSESDVSAVNPAGFFGQASKAFSVGYSAQWIGSAQDGTVGLFVSTSDALKSWLHGQIITGAKNTGQTIGRVGALRPTIGTWVNAATTYGFFIGARPFFDMNAGCTADYTYAPAVGGAMGETGATSAESHKFRFISTDAGSAFLNIDIYSTPFSQIMVSYNGTIKTVLTANGGIIIGGSAFVSGGNSILLDPTSGGRALSLAGTGTGQQLAFYNGNGSIGSIVTNGSTTTYNTSSDRRLKEDIEKMDGETELERICRLSPSKYRWKIDGSAGEGFIADDLQSEFPLAVTGAAGAIDDAGAIVAQSIDPSKIISSLVAAIQALNEKIKRLESHE